MARLRFCFLMMLAAGACARAQIVLHAARLLDVEAGRVVRPGEVLVEGERIVEAGTKVTHPAGVRVIDLGDTTLMPGLIDAHVHLFLHPGAEDLQTVEESVPQRTIVAVLAARDDLMAGLRRSGIWGPKAQGRRTVRCAMRSTKDWCRGHVCA